ncbi:sensor histidine kinase [Anaerosporobacter sp.]
MKTLRNRMIILYSITTMIIVILLSLAFNRLVTTKFRKYDESIHNKQVRQKIENVADMENSINHAILLIGIIFLLIAIIISIIIANRISNPITSVVGIAKRIANGEYGVQAKTRTRTKELQDLICSVNEMSLELEKEEIQKKQMCTDVAHELRTPLCNLQGNVEAMLDGLWEPTKERLSKCHTEILRLANLVNQLQELYLLESTYETIYMTKFNFYDLCCRLGDELEKTTNNKNITIQLHVPEDATIYGDVQRIKQCMFNLVDNAITYSTQGSKIEIYYELVMGKEVVIRVRDYGQGISKEDLGSIFERFYRVDKSRNSKTGGIGIGLSITKAIIERHNGSIKVYSKLGEGTTFEIHLPAVPD